MKGTKLICHRCNEIFAVVTGNSWDDDWDDVRGCECGRTIHKTCFKDHVDCPDLEESPGVYVMCPNCGGSDPSCGQCDALGRFGPLRKPMDKE